MTGLLRLRLAPDVVAVRVADETVTWHRVTGKLSLLDQIATQVVTRLDGRPTEAVIDELRAVFDAPAEVIRRDVEMLLTRLRDLGVVAPSR